MFTSDTKVDTQGRSTTQSLCVTELDVVVGIWDSIPGVDLDILGFCLIWISEDFMLLIWSSWDFILFRTNYDQMVVVCTE